MSTNASTLPTYSEKSGKEPFNWFKALSVPSISFSDWKNLIDRSRQWTTCACGNQCYIIPRDSTGRPIDKILAMLGGDNGFHGAIRANEAEQALYFLKLIEARSAELIEKNIPDYRAALRKKVIDTDAEVRKSVKDIAARHRLERKNLNEFNTKKKGDLAKELSQFEAKFGKL